MTDILTKPAAKNVEPVLDRGLFINNALGLLRAARPSA